MTQFVKTRRDGAVLVVTLDRPDKKNALTGAMYDALTLALSVANDEPGVGSVLFLGSGGCFTAGNDIADFLAFATNAQIRGAGESPALRFIRALAAAQKPMVASVDGVAIGIGTTLILHCDYVLASPRTVFQTPFVDLGLVPEAGRQRQRVHAAALVDVDEVEADRRLAHARLAFAGVGQVHLFDPHDLGRAEFAEPDGAGHRHLGLPLVAVSGHDDRTRDGITGAGRAFTVQGLHPAGPSNGESPWSG